MPTEDPPRPQTLRVATLGAALVVVTFAAFSGVLSNSFLAYDDDDYVTANAHVLLGLNGGSVAWAFRSTDAANWHPLTWLSHMLDVRLFGLDAEGHHLTSLLLHAVNVLLLFLLLVRMTGALWRPAFVAALFAIHPLHVESVAWIAERKDVLSTLFWLLTLSAWLSFLESRTALRYALVLVLFALGLMAKPMLVTLPFTMLLIDTWPLRRVATFGERVWEKTPLFVMSAASCVVTFIAQRRGGSIETLSGLGLPARVANAADAYVSYLGKTLWPASLAAFYPHPGGVRVWAAIASALVLSGLTALAFRLARRAPYFAFGWFWYLGTLVPVIGLVQVGFQAAADRYTYVPLVGVFVAIAWGLADLAKVGRRAKDVVAALSASSLVVLFAITRAQVGHWADTASLFEHALAVTSNNFVAHNNLGLTCLDRGKPEEAVTHFREALRIKPDYAAAHNNLGGALHVMGRDAEAVDQLRQAIAGGLDSAGVHMNFGNALAGTGQGDAALEQYNEALRLQPESIDAHRNLGNLLHRLRRNDEAIAHFDRVVQLRPEDAAAHLGLATALAGVGRFDAALQEFNAALRLKPDSPVAYNGLGNLLAGRGRLAEAIESYDQALRLKPDYAEALNNAGQALAMMDRVPESIERFQEAVRINPDFAPARNNLGVSLARANRFPEAREQFEQALRIDPGFGQARSNLRRIQEEMGKHP
jgi:tetratricopeptide (TPR) repeat protein